MAENGGAVRESLLALAVAAGLQVVGEVMTADLSDLDVVALMIDGVHFAGHLCAITSGIGIDETKHQFWRWSMATPRTRPWSRIVGRPA